MLEDIYRQDVRRGTGVLPKVWGERLQVHNAYPGSSRRLPARNRRPILTKIAVDIK
jgi:hypothetical protein